MSDNVLCITSGERLAGVPALPRHPLRSLTELRVAPSSFDGKEPLSVARAIGVPLAVAITLAAAHLTVVVVAAYRRDLASSGEPERLSRGAFAWTAVRTPGVSIGVLFPSWHFCLLTAWFGCSGWSLSNLTEYTGFVNLCCDRRETTAV